MKWVVWPEYCCSRWHNHPGEKIGPNPGASTASFNLHLAHYYHSGSGSDLALLRWLVCSAKWVSALRANTHYLMNGGFFVARIGGSTPQNVASTRKICTFIDQQNRNTQTNHVSGNGWISSRVSISTEENISYRTEDYGHSVQMLPAQGRCALPFQ